MIKIMFNEDNTHQFGEYYEAGVRPTPEIAEEYIRQYAGTQVTDYLINVNSLNSSYPSKYFASYDQKYLEKEENGFPVDYSDSMAKVYYQMFIEDRYDMYAHWIELLRQINIRPWLSFRMNDCHQSTEKTGYMLCDFFHEHPEFRRTGDRPLAGGFDNCFDYAHPEIRERMLNYIDEALDRYDVDGIELDFMREMFCFSFGGETDGRDIMTDFIKEVRKILKKYSDLRHKPMPLLIRVPYSPELCFDSGFDVLRWAEEGLAEYLVASPRWCPTDNDIPVEFWKQVLKPYPVKFSATTELILRSKGAELALNTHETAMATCFQHLSAGADFVYLFNYMRSNVSDYNNPDNYIMYSELYKPQNYRHLLCNAGTYETAIQCVRRHVPTFHDMQTDVRNPFPARCLEPNSFSRLRIRTGDVPEDAEVTLILAASSLDETKSLTADDISLFINTHAVTFIGTEKVTPELYTKKTGYRFSVKPEFIRNVNTVEISRSPKEGSLPFEYDYAEIRIVPENPRQTAENPD